MPQPMITLSHALAAPLLALTLLLLPNVASAQSLCPGEPLCREVAAFSATITDFRVSPNTVGNRPVNLTVRFTNKGAQPLILGHVKGTAAAFDDRGNKYELQSSSRLRGMGMVERNRFDPKFTLAPGESADARLEVNFHVGRNVIVGTAFDFEMSVREIDRVAGDQFRLGREHALSWQSLTNGAGGRPPVAAAVAPAAPTVAGNAVAPQPAVPPGDACAGVPHCTASGPVLAKVVGVQSAAPAGNNHLVTVRIAFQNLGAEPMILNYKQSTGEMLDEHGEQYTVDWRYNDSVQGMPISTRDKASSQFTLRSGESRTAAFIFRRYVGRVPAGTSFSPSIAVEQYTLLPSNQLQLQREYSLSFGTVQGGAAAQIQNLGEALKGLSDLLRR